MIQTRTPAKRIVTVESMDKWPKIGDKLLLILQRYPAARTMKETTLEEDHMTTLEEDHMGDTVRA